MATNNFKAFGTAAGANVTSQADYESLNALLVGFQSGKASSAQINKALRQSSFVASVLAQFISDAAGVDVLDNGDAAALLTSLIAALKANGANDFLQKTNNLAEIAAAGPTAVNTALANLGLRNRITPEFAPLLWYTNTAPLGYIAWQGQAITNDAYPGLYAIFGSKLPDSRDQFLRFTGANRQALSKQNGSSISPFTGNITGTNEMGVFIDSPDGNGLSAPNFQRYLTAGAHASVGATYLKVRPDNIALTLISKAG